MAKSRPKTLLRIVPPRAIARAVHFEDRSFSLGISHEVAILLLEALDAVYGHTELSSQNRIWLYVRMIAKYLIDSKQADLTRLPGTILPEIYNWLAPQKYSKNYLQTAWNSIRHLIYWCDRNHPGMFAGKIRYDLRFFGSEPTKKVDALDRETSERIMSCALQEIDEICKRISRGRDEAETSATQIGSLVAELLSANDGRFPNQATIITASSNLIRRVLAAGGVRKLVRTIYPTRHDLLPFYLAIQFQLAGNPLAVRNMRRDCITPNYLREDREQVNWQKPRSKKMQLGDFSRGKANAAPSLIRKLKELNEVLLDFPEVDRTKLFLCYNSGRVGIPTEGSWIATLTEFQKRHDLPNFKFSQLRKTAAVLHHKAGGSILHAKNKLNHRSVSATIRYTELSDQSEKHDQTIAENQIILARTVLQTGGDANELRHAERPKEEPADTVFGFLCSTPMGGFGDLNGRDAPCDHFSRCAGCPGALVPLDRIDVVAALLRSRDALTETYKRAQKENWIERFNALYRPTLDVIEEKLLPNVSKTVLENAAELAKLRPFPNLE